MANSKFYYINTYGCQMNEHDSEKLAGMLAKMGYSYTDNPQNADIILLNTCMIRENAELSLYGKVGSFKKLKENNPDLIIGVCGCMMQTEKARNEIINKYPYVDLIFGTHNIEQLPEYIDRLKQEDRVIEILESDRGCIPKLPVQREDDHKAWVSIIKGCNNFCSYCVVPYVRGRERSRSPESIIDEFNKLVEQGVIEITLLGQNVNSYGKDLDRDIDFADLLSMLNSIDGLKRIRYMTSHPRDFNDKLIDVISESKKICEHFHLPVQSGSSKILKKMNRGYSREEYINLINKIKAKVPEYSITTDFIVGFPGETEQDFADTISLVKKIRYDMAFTFKYSIRPNTRAAEMENQVAEDIKDRRLQELMSVQNKISREENQKYNNKIVNVLIDGESKNNPQTFSGRTRTNKLVIVPRQKDILGKIVKVKIKEAQSWTLYGDII